MKIVLDSNVIVAAYAGRGLCSSLFELCLDRYEIIISDYILSEVYRALHEKIKIPKDKTSMIIDYLKEVCVVSKYEKLSGKVCRDRNDDDIIALALSNDVRYIITGDKDLLDMAKFKSVKMLSPRDFWGIARESNG
jgi:uncharacterized protein